MDEIAITQGDGAVACSASGADIADAPNAQPDLPSAVADMRARIHQAAVACDFERLASLTSDQFTYSFGDSGDPAAYWRRLEAEGGQGEQPMRYLAGLLNRPYGTVTVEGRTRYVWPSAFAYSSWEDVPEQDREVLKPLYDEQDFADWARFGGYIGYRIGITEGGEWETFVAGD